MQENKSSFVQNDAIFQQKMKQIDILRAFPKWKGLECVAEFVQSCPFLQAFNCELCSETQTLEGPLAFHCIHKYTIN